MYALLLLNNDNDSKFILVSKGRKIYITPYKRYQISLNNSDMSVIIFKDVFSAKDLMSKYRDCFHILDWRFSIEKIDSKEIQGVKYIIYKKRKKK